MSRFDKYDPVSGGFRAPLSVAIAAADVGVIKGVSLNTSGQVVIGGATNTQRGVICPSNVMSVGDIIDVMTDGEIVDVPGLVAGTAYGSQADGDIAAGTGVGWTVQAWRLVVRWGRTFTATA